MVAENLTFATSAAFGIILGKGKNKEAKEYETEVQICRKKKEKSLQDCIF